MFNHKANSNNFFINTWDLLIIFKVSFLEANCYTFDQEPLFHLPLYYAYGIFIFRCLPLPLGLASVVIVF